MAVDIKTLVPAFLSLSKKLATTQKKLDRALLSSEVEIPNFRDLLKTINILKNGIKKTKKIHFPDTIPRKEPMIKHEILETVILKLDLEKDLGSRKMEPKILNSNFDQTETPKISNSKFDQTEPPKILKSNFNHTNLPKISN